MIAIATCLDMPEPDVDESLLLAALDSAGIPAKMEAWDDPKVDWRSYQACVIRSTWNYPECPGPFRAWLERVSKLTMLYNDAETCKWNLDKRYLADLQTKGVEIVPTVWYEKGTTPQNLPWPDTVLKPTISAGSMYTERFKDQEEAERFLAGHLPERAMMGQPYLPSVERGGEVAWVWIDGEVTHGVRKAPRFHDGFESVSEAVQPDNEARDLCARIMEAAPTGLLYARIDVMEHEGRWLLSELELLEPSLFFKQNPAALDRFTQAIRRRISSPS